MAFDYDSFANEIQTGVIDEMGSPFILQESETVAVGKTGKRVTTTIEHEGVAVRGSYDSDFITKDTVVQAGDVKFVGYFIEPDFEPSDKKSQVILFGNTKYTVIHVKKVAPSADTTICYILQARRVN